MTLYHEWSSATTYSGKISTCPFLLYICNHNIVLYTSQILYQHVMSSSWSLTRQAVATLCTMKCRFVFEQAWILRVCDQVGSIDQCLDVAETWSSHWIHLWDKRWIMNYELTGIGELNEVDFKTWMSRLVMVVGIWKADCHHQLLRNSVNKTCVNLFSSQILLLSWPVFP